MDYKYGHYGLSPIGGQFNICKYDKRLGRFTAIESINNPDESVYTKRKTFFGFPVTDEKLIYQFKTEEEWIKYAIVRARELNADRVYYRNYMGHRQSGLKIWDRITEEKYQNEPVVIQRHL